MKKATKLLSVTVIAIMLFALTAASFTTSAASISEVLETTYAIDQILFGEEEVNGFTFHYFDKADNTIKDMVYMPIGESPWNPGLDMYTGPTEEGECEGYEYIIFNYTYGCPTIHPSAMGNTGCAFTAPYTGTIKIMTYFRVGSALPDASELFIYKNEVSDATLLFQQMGTEDGSTSEYEVTVDVEAGDKIYWFVDCAETTTSDSCDFNPRIQYTAVNDENVTDDPVVDNTTTEAPATNDDTTASETNTTADDTTTAGNDTTTAGNDTTADTGTTAGDATADDKDTDNSGLSIGAIIGIVAAVIVVAAVVVILVKRKK